MFSLKGSDQALFGGSSRLLGVQESAGCIADDDGSGTQWDNFRVIEGGAEFVFIQEPGADSRPVMIAAWLQATAAEHSGTFHSLIKSRKLMAALPNLLMHSCLASDLPPARLAKPLHFIWFRSKNISSDVFNHTITESLKGTKSHVDAGWPLTRLISQQVRVRPEFWDLRLKHSALDFFLFGLKQKAKLF